MRVWIDEDWCTGAGLCVDHCPDIFVVLDTPPPSSSDDDIVDTDVV